MLLLCVLFNIALIQLDVLKCQMWRKTEKSIICQNVKKRKSLGWEILGSEDIFGSELYKSYLGFGLG